MQTPSLDAFKGYRFPREIISHAVWLYYDSRSAFGDVRTFLPTAASMSVTKPSMSGEQRFWSVVCRCHSAKPAKAGRQVGILMKVVIKINGEIFYLLAWPWIRHGDVLDILVQKRRNKRAAKRFLESWFKAHGCDPRVMITDKLRSYSAAAKRHHARCRSSTA